MGDPGEGDAKAVPVEPPAEPGHEAPAGASPAGPPWDESRWNGSPWARDAPPDIVEPRRDGDRSSAEPAPIGGTRPTVPRPGPRAAPVRRPSPPPRVAGMARMVERVRVTGAVRAGRSAAAGASF